MENKIFIAQITQRLDLLCAEQFQISRSKASNIIKTKFCIINGKATNKPSLLVNEGDKIEFPFTVDPVALEIQSENIPLNIIYEDTDIIVINKQTGMVVHPAAGNESGTLVNALMYHSKNLSGINGELRPGIVHRLDKDTSGILMVAKNDTAHVQLADQIQNRSIQKYYIAVCLGHFKEDNGIIIKPIARSKKDRKKMSVDENGRYAETHWFKLAETSKVTLLLIKIITGRTHQIRVHLSSVSRPIVGDVIYNTNNAQGRLLLHAYRLEFTHPIQNTPIKLIADIPEDFYQYANKFGLHKNDIQIAINEYFQKEK